ncbi:MAG: DNA repair protein RecN [Lachnospiraceae bacterium]|nr:DNA repair protein RecN [Lachnospiraceae bacterium]
MLLNLHVKNLALIREADIDLENGLNIFTGETGAGKSLLLGSVNLALGARLSGEVIRHGEDSALVELTFAVENGKTAEALKDAGFEPEEDLLVISRKITGNKSVFRINGETVSSAQIRTISHLLLDIHGQHEHQSLLYSDRQLAILDEYGGDDIRVLKEEVKACYDSHRKITSELSAYDLDENARNREIGLIEYELEEIDSADLKDGEEEQLEAEFKKMKNSQDIAVALNRVHEYTGYDSGAADLIGRAVKEISQIADLDDGLQQLSSELADAESLIGDISRASASYLSDLTFSDAQMRDCEKRLDEIRRIESKFGPSPAKVAEYREQQAERLEFLENYANQKVLLEQKLETAGKQLVEACGKLTRMRKLYAEKLSGEIIKELKELNFNQVRFCIELNAKEASPDGADSVEYRISVNPGEPMQALAKIASGGELSRIMLAIKTILVQNDPSETLIFDEIDAGISGQTAAKVAEKLTRIARSHQVLCITHLAQIAAAADAHYSITKTVDSDETYTHIMKLDDSGSERELARLLGGSTITETAMKNAREMKQMAKKGITDADTL